MMVASESQSKTLGPVVRYFEGKQRDREEKDVADKRFIASVQELMRAEGQDQIEWAERRRCRLRASAGNKPPRTIVMSDSSSLPQLRKTEGHKAAIGDNTKRKSEDALDPTQAMIRIGQLKSTLAKAPDPPTVAAELALLYLVLSDQRGALKSFQLAVKPSPERVPTKEETDERETQLRKLALLNKEKRAKALAELKAQDAEREWEREAKENARRRRAATGIYLCLLELKQPVEAAEAARARLGMCETEAELHQVEVELHDALLKHDGLVEPTATNQGAWLTESAGALSDLHSTVLGSLAGLCVREDPAQPSHRSALSRDAVGVSEARGVPNGADMSSSRRGVDGSLREANIGEDRQETLRKQSGSGRPLAKEAIVSVGPHGTSRRGGAARAGEAEPRGPSAPQDRGATTATATTVAGCGRRQAEGRRNQRRARLRHLGLLLARKRQFAASRQVFDDALRGGPEEVALRERNKAHTPGFFLDVALEEASPKKLELDLDSRWQGGMETDEAHRRALADFTRFTGLHRGAETLVVATPPAGWAEGGNSASEVAHAERLSRSRARVGLLQQEEIGRETENTAVGTNGLGFMEEAIGGAAKRAKAAARAATAASGLMLGHAVPAKDVIAQT